METNNNRVTYLEYNEDDLLAYNKVRNIMLHNDFVRLFEYSTYSKYKTLLTNYDIELLIKMYKSLDTNLLSESYLDGSSLVEYILQNYLWRVKEIDAEDLYSKADLDAIKYGWFIYDFEWGDLL